MENISPQDSRHCRDAELGHSPKPRLRLTISRGRYRPGLYDALLSTMKNGRTLGCSGRFAQSQPIILKTFDLLTMARLSVGPTWAILADIQRQQTTETFGRYISALYADRFDSYSGQKVEVTDEQPAPSGIKRFEAVSLSRTESRSRWTI
jgi:hypothetical protein